MFYYCATLFLLISAVICDNLNVTEFAECVGLERSQILVKYQEGTEAIVIHPINPTDYDDYRWIECFEKQNISGEVFHGDGTYLEDMELQDATGIALFEDDILRGEKLFTEDSIQNSTQPLIRTDLGINYFMYGERKCAGDVQRDVWVFLGCQSVKHFGKSGQKRLITIQAKS